LALWVTQSVGPRIIGLALPGGDNLLAELPDETLECPGRRTFSFYGGHGLWYAPEDPRRIYLPDDAPVTFADVADGVLVTQPIEAQTGIQESLHNRSTSAVELAPGAITQLKPGGVAILPQATTLADMWKLYCSSLSGVGNVARFNTAIEAQTGTKSSMRRHR